MEDTGIITQYGFVYQRKVFINQLLKNMKPDTIFYYEQYDDVAYNEKDYLTGTLINSHLIQCKTGNVSFTTLKHVFANWLNQDRQVEYILYVDSELNDLYSNKRIIREIFKDINAYVRSGKHNLKAVIYKTYLKYNKFQNLKDLIVFIHDLKYIYNKFKCEKKEVGELDDDSYNNFIPFFGTDLCIEYAKRSRFELFYSLINDAIEKSIIKKEAFKIEHVMFQNIGYVTIKSIDDNKFTLDYYTFKNNKTHILEDYSTRRETIFLKKIYSNDKIVAKYLTNELYYKELRDFYLGIEKNILVSGIEETANCNYLEKTEIYQNVRDVFINTLDTEIDNRILINKEFNQGCYIFLTSDDAEDDKFIDWCGENAK